MTTVRNNKREYVVELDTERDESFRFRGDGFYLSADNAAWIAENMVAKMQLGGQPGVKWRVIEISTSERIVEKL